MWLSSKRQAVPHMRLSSKLQAVPHMWISLKLQRLPQMQLHLMRCARTTYIYIYTDPTELAARSGASSESTGGNTAHAENVNVNTDDLPFDPLKANEDIYVFKQYVTYVLDTATPGETSQDWKWRWACRTIRKSCDKIYHGCKKLIVVQYTRPKSCDPHFRNDHVWHRSCFIDDRSGKTTANITSTKAKRREKHAFCKDAVNANRRAKYNPAKRRVKYIKAFDENIHRLVHGAGFATARWNPQNPTRNVSITL